MISLEVSVIISTYNQPEWLRKVLIGYCCQRFSNFEIIVADDGSNDETVALINDFQRKTDLTLHHVWHKDMGFRKTSILNKAIEKTATPYLIFTDGDCIPRADFVLRHYQLRRECSFLSGGYFKLPISISHLITETDIITQQCFNKEWLITKGLKHTFKTNKLNAYHLKEWLLNTFTTTKATFDGMNASVWKEDILKVNGFDTRMQYGGEDRELGERLINLGIKPIQIRYSAICLHLEHERNYISEASIKKNNTIRNQTKTTKSTWTNFGLLDKCEV